MLKLISFPETWDIQVFATDISKDAIEEAKVGIYNKNQLKPVSDILKKKYFDKVFNSEKDYQITENIRRLIHFQNMNLMNLKFRNFNLF